MRKYVVTLILTTSDSPDEVEDDFYRMLEDVYVIRDLKVMEVSLEADETRLMKEES